MATNGFNREHLAVVEKAVEFANKASGTETPPAKALASVVALHLGQAHSMLCKGLAALMVLEKEVGADVLSVEEADKMVRGVIDATYLRFLTATGEKDERDDAEKAAATRHLN